MSSSNCCFLAWIHISQEAGKVAWYSHLLKNFPQFVMIHTVKVFVIVNTAKIDVFLELSCFFCDPTSGNLICGSSALGSTVTCCRVRGLNPTVGAQVLLKRLPLPSLPLPEFGLKLNNREGTQPHPSTEYWTKDLLSVFPAPYHPSKQDPVSPTISLSHQEAYISLLSLFIRSQTEWKPQSQKNNQTDDMDHSLV